MPQQRPNPERLLRRAKEEQSQSDRGQLKIYLGAAPGVGKTHMMLRDALAQREQGLDVIVGVIEAHGRSEVETLSKSFETMMPQKIAYRGKELSEFDLDAALKRNPTLILMDEMAHTNAPDLRHNKRWQDIKELLDRGINVYTTLNVQHIESLNDVVSQIIHTRIKETIPDSMLELANTIELVDLPPEDLLKRLKEGKVYIPKQAELAVEHFFRKGNLIALRELALRVTAERVSAQVLSYRQGQGIQHIWPTKEKILVCVGPGREVAKLIRAGRRMATNFKAQWFAIHVDAPRLNLTEAEHNHAIQNLRLAEQLGAQTQILTGFDAITEIMHFAREQNITKLIVGKSIRPRWHDLIFRNFADEIVRHSNEIDTYIISGQAFDNVKHPKVASSGKNLPWAVYAFTLAALFATTLLNLVLYPYLDESNLIMIYLLGATVVATFGRTGPVFLFCFCSISIYGFLFEPPFYSFAYAKLQYLFTLLAILFVTNFLAYLRILTKRQTRSARSAAQRSVTLHTLSRQLASTRGVDKLLATAVSNLSDIFDSEILALLPEAGSLEIRARYKTDAELDAKESGVAQWVFDMGQLAGLGTDTLPFSDSIYVPLLTTQGTIGVLRFRPFKRKKLFTPEQMHLVEACANQIALAIEVDRMQEQSKLTELALETDRVRSSLLQAVSHDLRAPLVAIMGSAHTLIETAKKADSETVRKIGSLIYAESEQATRLINNLLQMTYLEGDEVKLNKEHYSFADELNSILGQLDTLLKTKPVVLTIPQDLPKIPFDRMLLTEVFNHLIDNATKFSEGTTPLEIVANLENDKIVVSVQDHGPGIVQDEVNKLFEKYYRGRKLTSERGLGLGLAICQRIIKAHGGQIWAENRKEGGAVFHFTLPFTTTAPTT